MKKIAVHVDEQYPNSFSKKWIEYINKTQEYEAKLVDLKSCDSISQVGDCCGVMWHYRHTPVDKQVAPKVLTAIEEIMNIPVWPNRQTRWHFDEKVAQHYLLQSSNVPHIKSWVFWNYVEAKDFLESTNEYPLVFKLSVGAGAANVIKLNNKAEALPLLKKMFYYGVFPYTENEYKNTSMEGDLNFPSINERLIHGIKYICNKKMPPLPWYYQIQKDYFYIQKFVPNNEYDIRITVIGDRIFGFTRKNRANDFRASGSGKIDYSTKNIPIDAVKTAYDLSSKKGFQSMSYDFLINDKNEALISEMGYGYNSKAVYECTGHWDKDFQWHDGGMWPQQAHIEDFINKLNCNNVI